MTFEEVEGAGSADVQEEEPPKGEEKPVTKSITPTAPDANNQEETEKNNKRGKKKVTLKQLARSSNSANESATTVGSRIEGEASARRGPKKTHFRGSNSVSEPEKKKPKNGNTNKSKSEAAETSKEGSSLSEERCGTVRVWGAPCCYPV